MEGFGLGGYGEVGWGDPQRTSVAGGDVVLDDIQVVPGEPEAGESVVASVTLSNTATAVQGAGNPDCCGSACGLPGGYGENGYAYEMRVSLASETATDSGCLPTSQMGDFNRDLHFEMPAPSAGEYELEMVLRLPGSGDEGTARKPLIVKSSGVSRQRLAAGAGAVALGLGTAWAASRGDRK